MRTEIKAGAQLDILDQNELRTVLQETLSGYLRPPQRLRLEQGAVLDADGNGTVILWTVELGNLFLLNRLHIDPGPAYTYATPFTATDGYLNVLGGDGQVWDGTSFDPTAEGISLPGDITANDSTALFYYGGEKIEIDIVGGPASGSVLVRGQGLLEPLPFAR